MWTFVSIIIYYDKIIQFMMKQALKQLWFTENGSAIYIKGCQITKTSNTPCQSPWP